MSLTSHLKDKNSPVSRFLRERFPDTRAVADGCRAALGGATTLRPAQRVPYSLIGTALDYRLRYYFAITPPERLAAWGGARLACSAGSLHNGRGRAGVFPEPTTHDFFADLASTLSAMQPVHRRLKTEDEALLARYCVALALFEQVFRSGQMPPQLLAPATRTSTAALLELAEDVWVDDLRALSWAFFDGFEELLAQPAILNPCFEGSVLVGGADADLILDSCLLDIKATINPRLDGEWLYQLLGYALLDFNDEYQISDVGIYLARQQLLLHWPLPDVMRLMAGGEAPPAQLRREFRTLLSTPPPFES